MTSTAPSTKRLESSTPSETAIRWPTTELLLSTTVASVIGVWSSPGRVWEGRSVDVCCGLVGLAGGVGTRTGGLEEADRTGVGQGRTPGDRRCLSRWLAVRGRAQDRLASGRAGRA